MKLTPQEVDKLKLCNAGYVAQKRLARGVRLVSLEHQLARCTGFVSHQLFVLLYVQQICKPEESVFAFERSSL